MLSLSRMLKKLAERHCLAVAVSNHVVSSGGAVGWGTMSKPALGEHWRNQANWRLLLSNTPQRRHDGVLIKMAQRIATPLQVLRLGHCYRVSTPNMSSYICCCV